MLTITEIKRILSDNFTCSEIVEMLDIDPDDLVYLLEDVIEDNTEKLNEIIEEEIGL